MKYGWLRWMDNVREDLRRMGVTNWRIRARKRELEDGCEGGQGPTRTAEPWSSRSSSSSSSSM